MNEWVNEWVRNSAAFDGYVDFDRALQDTENQLQILPVYDSGDGRTDLLVLQDTCLSVGILMLPFKFRWQ